ncbi:MAG: type II secretion system protein GspG [Bradymonadales bacterium]|jgi:hypothetical protein
MQTRFRTLRFQLMGVMAILACIVLFTACKSERRSAGEAPEVKFDDTGKMHVQRPIDAAPDVADNEQHLLPKEEFVGGVMPNERKAQKLVNQLSNYTMAICSDMLECPAGLDELKKEMKERYKLNWPNDPWGNPYAYTRTDSSKFVIISWGPDKEAGTADDIKISERNE